MAVNLGETPVTTKPKIPAPVTLPSREIVYEIEQFLFREVRLLEEERYEEWLGTDDRRHSLLDARHSGPLSQGQGAALLAQPHGAFRR